MAATLKTDKIGNKTDTSDNLTLGSSGSVTVGGALTATSGTLNGVTLGSSSATTGAFTNVTATNIQATSGQSLSLKEDGGTTVVSIDTSGNVAVDPAATGTITLGEAGDNTVSGALSGHGADRHAGQSIELQAKVSGIGYQSGSTSSSAARGVGVMYAGITGEIKMYGGVYAPEGWVLCDGTAYTGTPNSLYKNLFDVIGTSYGNGASGGTGEFNVPDLRGRVMMGAGTGAGGGAEDADGGSKPTGGSSLTARSLGEWGGAETHVLTITQMPQHAHSVSNHTHTFSATTGTAGNHRHSYTSPLIPGTRSAKDGGNYPGDTEMYPTPDGGYTTYAGNHTHSVSGTTDNGGSSNTSNAGSNSAHNILQPYVCVNYIIKL